jgi:hypothetical protein
MLVGKIHKGSGLGDSLFSYITTRSLALDKGYDFGFVGIENFKGSFMDLDWGKPVDLKYHIEYPAGKLIVDDEHTLYEPKVNYYDPEFNFIEDGTVIDGCTLQDERYFEQKMEEINKWFQVKPILPHEFRYENVCAINFRGGEFALFPDLFLTKDYWDEAIERMKAINPEMQFEVHTDDETLAKQFFPEFKIFHEIGTNWRSLRFAKYAIISNSAFAIIPRLLQHYNEVGSITIAPRYWARHNTKEWHLPQNYYKQFTYI